MKDLYDPGQIGLHLLTIPEEYGGLGGGAYDIYRVSEAMASIDLGIATGVLATFLGTDPINVGATPEQKKHWISALAEHGHFYAYGATEPQAGSDLGALTTTAVPVEEDGQGRRLPDHRPQAVDQQRRRRRPLHDPRQRARRPLVVRRRPRDRGLHARQARGQARHPRLQHRRALPRERLRAGRPADRRRRGPGARAGAGRLRLHAPDGRGVRPRRRLGGAAPRHPLLAGARAGRRRR